MTSMKNTTSLQNIMSSAFLHNSHRNQCVLEGWGSGVGKRSVAEGGKNVQNDTIEDRKNVQSIACAMHILCDIINCI